MVTTTDTAAAESQAVADEPESTAPEFATPEPDVFDESQYLPPAPAEREEVPPTFLDLNDIDTPQLPVTLGDTVYYMPAKDDLSMADREELRLVLLQLSDLMDRSTDGKKKSLSEAEKKTYLNLEQRLCKLALPDCPDEIITRLTARQRNLLTERFFQEADVMAIVRSFVSGVQAKQLKSQGAGAMTMGGNMPSPPPDLLGLQRSATTTGKLSSIRGSRPD